MIKTLIAPVGTHESSDGVNALVSAMFGVGFVALESSDDAITHHVHGYATDTCFEMRAYQGYTIEFTTRTVKSLVGDLCEYHVTSWWENDSYGKVIRTHEEVKERMDELWCDATRDERFVLRRLYEFMCEPHPEV